jgi:hypothetical protein
MTLSPLNTIFSLVNCLLESNLCTESGAKLDDSDSFGFYSGSPLCPATASKHMCEMLPASEKSPAFLFPKGSDTKL